MNQLEKILICRKCAKSNEYQFSCYGFEIKSRTMIFFFLSFSSIVRYFKGKSFTMTRGNDQFWVYFFVFSSLCRNKIISIFNNQRNQTIVRFGNVSALQLMNHLFFFVFLLHANQFLPPDDCCYYYCLLNKQQTYLLFVIFLPNVTK